MNLKTLDSTKLPLLEVIFVTFLFALYLLPSVSIGSTVVLALILAYCGYIVLVDRSMFSKVGTILILIFLIALSYTLLTETSSISQYTSNRMLKRFVSKTYQYLAIYFPAILFLRVNKIATKKQKKYLAIIGIALIVYVVITTWIFLADNPNATREWENFEENSSQGVANYYFIYAIPIILSVISIIWVKAKGILKLLSLGLIIVGIIFLVNAQYTLSILIAIIGVLIQLFRNLRSAFSKIFFIVTMLLVLTFLPQIMELAISKIQSEQVTTRLSEILAFMTGQGAGGYNLNGRLTLYGNTIKAFLHSPLWGNRTLSFDGHSTFLMVLADTGILGGVPFYLLLVTICRNVKSQLLKSRSQFNVVIIMFVMMGLTNPIHASLPLGFVTWFLAPLTIQQLIKEDYLNEKAMEN